MASIDASRIDPPAASIIVNVEITVSPAPETSATVCRGRDVRHLPAPSTNASPLTKGEEVHSRLRAVEARFARLLDTRLIVQDELECFFCFFPVRLEHRHLFIFKEVVELRVNCDK